MAYFEIKQELIPFVAQIVATILRVVGWTTDLSTGGKTVSNREIRDKLVALNTKLNATNEKFVQDGRLRLEKGSSSRVVKLWLFLGDVRRSEKVQKGMPTPEPTPEEEDFRTDIAPE